MTATADAISVEPPQRRSVHELARKIIRVALPAALLAIVGLIALHYERARDATPIHYEAAAVDRGPIEAKVAATGTLSALVTVSVGSQVSGRIETIRVDYESSVRQGQIVATIDPAQFRAAVAQARANLLSARAGVDRSSAQDVNAERQFVRAKTLVASGLMTASDYDVAEAALGVAKAQLAADRATVVQSQAALDQAELSLSYTTIASPIDGVVISRNVDVGQTVAATLQSPTLFTIAQDLTHMQVDTNVAEADVGKIRSGMAVTFTVDAYPAREFAGVVRQVRENAQTIQNVVTYDAVIDVENRERALMPGMTASVTFVYATRSDVPRLSNAALRFKPDRATVVAMGGGDVVSPLNGSARGDERVVWVLRNGHPIAAKARVGISDGTVTELTGGDVRAGDQAIAEATVDAKRSP